MNTARTQTVSQRDCHIIFATDVANVIEVGIEETLLLMHRAPFGNDTSTTAHHPRKSSLREVHILKADTTMDREIIDTLLGLFDERIAEKSPCEILNLSTRFFKGLIHRNGTHGHRTVARNPFTRLRDIIARRKIHQCVAAPFAAPYSFLHLLFNTRGDR